MDFVDILHSFEDALYEVVLWIVLLPKTLIRVLARPAWIQPYVSAEWGKKPADRFQGYLSPMLFWFLLGILPYALRDYYTSHTQSVLDSAGSDLLQTNFLLNAFILIIFPTYYAIVLQRLRHEPVEKDAVKRLFYIQCYVHTPIALFSMPLALLFIDFVSEYTADIPFPAMTVNPNLLLGYVILMGLWVVLVQSVIIHAELKSSWPRAVWLSLVYGLAGFVLMLLLLVVISVLVVLL